MDLIFLFNTSFTYFLFVEQARKSVLGEINLNIFVTVFSGTLENLYNKELCSSPDLPIQLCNIHVI